MTAPSAARPARAIVFDLDGTLIDSRLDLAHSVNNILASLGRNKLPVETVLAFVGDGAEDLIRRSLIATGISPEEAAAMLANLMPLFLDDYYENCLVHTLPYPGVISMLERFSDYKKAVLTNKPAAHTEKVLEGLGLRRYFEVIVGGDGPLGKKPAPGGFGYILSSLNTTPEETWMIGDGMQDLRVAKAIGCRFVAFLEGIGDPVAMTAAGPDHAIHNFEELTALLAGVKKKS